CSARVSRPVAVGGRPELNRPTAQMSFPDMPEMPASSFCRSLALGLGTSPQAAPSPTAAAAGPVPAVIAIAKAIAKADAVSRRVIARNPGPPAQREITTRRLSGTAYVFVTSAASGDRQPSERKE